MLFFVADGVLTAAATEEDAALVRHDGEPVFDIRKVKTKGAAPGWTLNDNGTASPPPEPEPAPEPPALDPVEKLRAFLSANPDVLQHIGDL
ncbi:hypothetical protein [Methylobacterium sp. D54C]